MCVFSYPRECGFPSAHSPQHYMVRGMWGLIFPLGVEWTDFSPKKGTVLVGV